MNPNFNSNNNPIYGDYKPNVPNAGKLMPNLINNTGAHLENNEKRSILMKNRGPLRNHLDNNNK